MRETFTVLERVPAIDRVSVDVTMAEIDGPQATRQIMKRLRLKVGAGARE